MYKYKCIIITFFLVCYASFSAISQSGRVYEFLNLPASAHITSIGGYGIPSTEHNIDMALFYPSLINKHIHQKLSLNVVNHFDDINYGTAAYSHTIENYGSFTGRVQYINYGKFNEVDETGRKLGTFKAAEYAIVVGWGRKLSEQFQIGSNLKIIGSDFYEYNSLGLAADVSGSYVNQEQLFAASILFRNIGKQITTYHSRNNEPLPFEIVAAASKELLNAPFRLFFVAHNLQKYDLTYDQHKVTNNAFQQQPEEDANNLEDFVNILMHHLIAGIEILPTDNLKFNVGYNYRRRQELKVESRLSTVGFSWGMGIKISRFQFNYGRSHYHLAGSPNHFSIAFNVDELFEKNTAKTSNMN